ncbi:ParB/RepB/Spo0J family partition protein [Tunturiibacter lichenicola]|uniref:ParB/RepB/Spo0J family partition protein n=1 Tax=Tunturiibacter lichenicola TaxID=2051959 RepID=UPI003D9B901A
MNTQTATEYRNLPLNVLSESTANPRRVFEDAALKELAESIRVQGVLSPLLVRPVTEQGFEIVAGARRYRAAQMAEAATVPVRIVNLTDAESLEAQLVENLIRSDVHPMEETNGFRALLNLEEPKYSIEQIAARTGKNPSFVAARLRLTELVPAAVEAFYREEIGVGHALLLAKLQPAQQEQALANCFREDWGGGSGKAKRILLPVRHLQHWIEHNVLLLLKLAPFNKRDAQLVPAAGSCVDCPKRTGNNKLLFAEWAENESQCTDPNCYAVKIESHVQKQVAAKPELVQISTAYGQQQEGSKIVTRSKYVEIRPEKPDTPEKANWPEFKTCKYTSEAIVADGLDKGEARKVCTQPDCAVHHPKKQPSKADASFKAEQDKRRREEALANATGLRVLQTIVAAVPVRLMKRDLLFIAEQMLPLLDEKRVEMVARNQGIRAKEGESAAKLLTAFLRKAEEDAIGKLIVEAVILLSASRQADGGKVLRAAAQAYKVDTDAIALKVKQEFTAKDRARGEKKPEAVTKPERKRVA